MAVLLEDISLLFRISSMEDLYPGGWHSFRATLQEGTYWDDGELAVVEINSISKIESILIGLEGYGFESNDESPTAFGDYTLVYPVLPGEKRSGGQLVYKENIKHGQRLVQVHLKGSKKKDIVKRPNWVFEESPSFLWSIFAVQGPEDFEKVESSDGRTLIRTPALTKPISVSREMGKLLTPDFSSEFLESLAEAAKQFREKISSLSPDVDETAINEAFEQIQNEMLPDLMPFLMMKDQLDAEACLKLASVFAIIGALDVALELLESTLDRFPENTQVKLNLATVLDQMGVYDEAKTLYEELSENDKSDTKVLLLLAGCLAEAGELEEAMIHARRVLMIEPDNELATGLLEELAVLEAEEPIFQAEDENEIIGFLLGRPSKAAGKSNGSPKKTKKGSNPDKGKKKRKNP